MVSPSFLFIKTNMPKQIIFFCHLPKLLKCFRFLSFVVDVVKAKRLLCTYTYVYILFLTSSEWKYAALEPNLFSLVVLIVAYNIRSTGFLIRLT